MSKQPCVWVVEKRVGVTWGIIGLHYAEWAAKSAVKSFGIWMPDQLFRVAKYVRVEPKKKGRK